VTIGTLPTIREQDLSLRNVSAENRYLALNEQVLALRGRRAIDIDIAGRDRLVTSHSDVMLEAATTALQVHLQCPASQAAGLYNASVVLSAPLVALAANSPFLFGHELWEETRIPLFEQAVDTATPHARVTLGTGYLGHPADYFRENVDRYPPLLPLAHDAPAKRLDHLRLHNGTIWRWVRLLAFDETPECEAHLRIEQRVMPAGPTIGDMIANLTVYVGAAYALVAGGRRPEVTIPFAAARENFYAAARDGLRARLTWLDGRMHDARRLVLEEILPLARSGLELMGVERSEAARHLDVVTARVDTGRTGAWWQREHAHRHGRDFERLVADYVARAHTGRPVHTWDLG
jgi:gamma-glutamyl:cysteine ligase YbdK (ATP-grasp superfamily)